MTRNMHTKSNNVEIMVVSEAGESIEKLFKSLLQRYQVGLEESMNRSEFIFDSVNLFLIVLIYCITIIKKQI